MRDPLPLSYEGGFRFGEIEIAARMWYTCAGETGIHGRYDTIRFETERPILRNYTTDDAPAAHEYFSDEEVLRYEVF